MIESVVDRSTLGLAVELAVSKVFRKLENLIETYVPDDIPEQSPVCDKTLFCAATEDHKRTCAGKTVSIEWYCSRIKGATL